MPLPTLDYYDEQYRKRKANEPVASITALDREITRMRSAEIRENLFLSASPDTVARVNRVARETGELPLLVEDRVADYEKALTEQKFIQASETINSLGKWAVNNPRAAAAAADDWESLAKFGKVFQDIKDDFLKDGGWFEQGGDFVERRAHGLLAGFDRFTVASEKFFESLTPESKRTESAKKNAEIVIRKARSRAEFGEKVQALPIRNEILWQEIKKNPSAGNVAAFIRQQGFASLPDLAVAATSLPIYTVGRSGEIGQQRAVNSGRDEANFGDVTVAAPFAAISGYLERLGLSKMILPGASSIGARIGKAAITEGGTEFAQEVIEYGGETIGTNAQFSATEALDRGFAGAVGGAGMGVTVRSVVESPQITKAIGSAVANMIRRDKAFFEGSTLDIVVAESEKSKLKTRDPEAFRSLLESLAGESEVENVYISGEALKEYMQSDAYEPSDALSGWLDRVEEASATGGDVVMPIAEAAITLGPIWQNIKDDVRLSAGGMSRKEAATFDEAMADVMDELATVMAEQDKAESQVKTEREALASSIIGKLQNAGFTPSTARTQAELLVQRYATRMARLGRPLTGKEFDAVTVNQVLPEELQAARKADQLDLVINSYFTMKNPKAATGKSLVEWIAERGGVTDEGGDLEDMGLGKWHREKAFRKRALRKSEKGQSSFVAADDKFSRNSVLRAAVDQGYFPELETETNLDERALLEAIDAELRGVPRYAQERIADDVRELAGQLDEFLSQSGFDPANMTPEQMRDAIESTQDAQLGGEVFEGAAAIEQEWDSIQGGEVVAFEDASGIRIEVKRTGPNTYEVSSLGGFQKLSEEQLKDNAREQNYIATAESKEEARKRNIAFGKRKYQVMQEVKALAEDIGAPDGFVRGYEKALSGEPMPQSYLDEAGAPYREGYERAVADGKAGTLSNTGPAREARQSTGQTYTQATITIDGVERPTQNSNGQPLAQTEEGLRNFYAWFKDSKVVDAEGRPLVVYHGTRSGEIEAFDPEALGKNTGAASARLGFFFAGSEATSLSYVDRTLTESDRETADGVVFGFDRIIADLAKWADESAPDFAKALRSSNVFLWHSDDDPGVAVQANSYDPSEVDGFGGYLDDVIREVDSAAFWEADLEGDLGTYAQSQIDRLQSLKDGYDNIDLNGTADQEAGSVVLQTYLKIERLLEVDQGGQAYRETSYYDLISQGKEAGSDGVVIRNTYDGGPKDDVFVAFSPEQIKSVNNRGTFDPTDARILYQSYGNAPDSLLGFTSDASRQKEYGNNNYTYVQPVSVTIAGETFTDEIEGLNAPHAMERARRNWPAADSVEPDGEGRRVLKQSYEDNARGSFDPTDARILYQSAFHGSPHIFDKFSLDKIGTGEGAQTYGWGLYFAGRKEIAEHYRKILSEETYVTSDGNVWSPDELQHLNIRVMARRNGTDLALTLKQISERGLSESDMRAHDEAMLKDLMARGGIEKASGRLYQVDIPEDNEYLLWDAPLSEQSAVVKRALLTLGFDGQENPTGQYIRKLMVEKAPITGVHGSKEDFASAEKWASLQLKDVGIAGIKYLDGGSRAAGDGSYNYVVFDDSRVSIQAYEQSYEDNARGKITFNSGQATIDLFKTRNLSTFLHETGHLWLEELAFDASLPDAPQQLKDDWQTVQDWFASQGHKVENGMIPTDAHEMWARGVERYLMEGKSPIGSLKRIFETFKAWLTEIYKTVDALKSPITPEVREVMDRLIATDEQIQDIAEQQKVEAMFKDAAEAGMSDAEFQAHVKQTEDALSEAKGKLIEKVMRSIRSRETKAYRDSAQNVRDEIEPEVDARPLFKALRNLKEQPIDSGWLKEEMGEDAFRLLPRRRPAVYKDGGVHPDVIAEQSGFATGKAMVEALMGAEIAHRKAKEGGDTRSMRERTIQEEVSAIMQARYGDPLNDGSIEREALEVVHNDMQGEVIASEIRVLARRSGKRPTPYAIAKDWARNKIRSGIVTQEASPSAIQRYARAAQRSATAAQEAMLKQDVEEAFRHKQAQMLNNALVSEAKKAFDDVEGAVKRLEKVAKRKTMKSVDQDYLEQAQALLEAVDIRRRSQVSIDKQGKFEAWAREREAEGFDVVVPASFGEMLGTTNWTRLTVENLLGLDDAVKQIMHLGRLKQTLLDNKEQRDFDELVKEATDGMGNLRQKPPSDMMEPTYWDGIKSKILAADAALLKMETVFDWLDNKDSDGVFNRVVFRPIADAQENERLMLEEYITKLTDALKAVPRGVLKRWGDKVETGLLNRETGNPYILTREQLVSIALNVGNQSNLDKLTGGYGWNEGQVLSVLSQELTEAEWNYVQSVWDTIESLWPQIEAMEKRLNGVAPEKIEPRSVETPFGVLKGGYFPVVYDPRKNYDAEANAAKGRDLFETIYTRATTPKGFTKERTNVERPIHLSLGIINRHVSEVIHDLTHREAIMQADKFLSNRRIMKGVDDTLGPEVRRQFRPWLQRIANEWAYDRAGQAGIENFIKQARLNTTIVGMGFRASTILMQIAGYSNSFERVGFKWVAKRLKDVGNPAAWDFVLSKSKEVAGRMNSLDRDIRDNIKDAMGKKRWLTAPKKFAFHGIAYMDRVVVVPTWLGAYDKALAEGRIEEDAIYAADKAVRQSQGSGAAKDLAAIQSGRGTAGEAFNLLTQFYSFMSAFYQRQRTFGRDVRNAKLNDAPALLARAWWLFIVPPVLAELLAGRGPDDDEDEALWAFEKIMLQVFGPIPIVRDVAPVALAKIKDEPTFGYKFTPVSGAMQSMINVSGDVSNIVEGEETKRATRNSIETIGYFTGLTTGQMAAAAQFLVDVSYGEQSPEDFADWWEGLTTGKIKEE